MFKYNIVGDGRPFRFISEALRSWIGPDVPQQQQLVPPDQRRCTLFGRMNNDRQAPNIIIKLIGLCVLWAFPCRGRDSRRNFCLHLQKIVVTISRNTTPPSPNDPAPTHDPAERSFDCLCIAVSIMRPHGRGKRSRAHVWRYLIIIIIIYRQVWVGIILLWRSSYYDIILCEIYLLTKRIIHLTKRKRLFHIWWNMKVFHETMVTPITRRRPVIFFFAERSFALWNKTFTNQH